ncbi:MAG TPA: flavodoxin domain-containing protein [Herpetosiphonaceae bacterium]
MSTRILVAYASEFGSTGEVAETIGQALRDAGATVDVRSVVDVDTLSDYGAAIVGSAIYNGAWLPEAVHLVQVHADALSRMPVAYFVVCATMREDTPEHRQGARSFLDPVLDQIPQVRPIDIGLFSGKIEPPRLPWPVRLRMRLTTDLRRGDYRRWDDVREWASRIAPQLQVGRATHDQR